MTQGGGDAADQTAALKDLADAEADIKKAPKESRGYLCKGAALVVLNRVDDACGALLDGSRSLKDGDEKGKDALLEMLNAALAIKHPPAKKPAPEKGRLMLLMFFCVVFGQGAVMVVKRGYPIVWTMALGVFLVRTRLVKLSPTPKQPKLNADGSVAPEPKAGMVWGLWLSSRPFLLPALYVRLSSSCSSSSCCCCWSSSEPHLAAATAADSCDLGSGQSAKRKRRRGRRRGRRRRRKRRRRRALIETLYIRNRRAACAKEEFLSRNLQASPTPRALWR